MADNNSIQPVSQKNNNGKQGNQKIVDFKVDRKAIQQQIDVKTKRAREVGTQIAFWGLIVMLVIMVISALFFDMWTALVGVPFMIHPLMALYNRITGKTKPKQNPQQNQNQQQQQNQKQNAAPDPVKEFTELAKAARTARHSKATRIQLTRFSMKDGKLDKQVDQQVLDADSVIEAVIHDMVSNQPVAGRVDLVNSLGQTQTAYLYWHVKGDQLLVSNMQRIGLTDGRDAKKLSDTIEAMLWFWGYVNVLRGPIDVTPYDAEQIARHRERENLIERQRAQKENDNRPPVEAVTAEVINSAFNDAMEDIYDYTH